VTLFENVKPLGADTVQKNVVDVLELVSTIRDDLVALVMLAKTRKFEDDAATLAAGALCRVLRRIGGEELVNQVRESVASHFPETSDQVTEFFSVIEDRRHA
jgi:hypothetical protein